MIALTSILLLLHARPSNVHLLTNASTCLPPGTWNSSTSTCTCLQGSILNSTSGSCICPSYAPWLNAGVCTPCSFPNVYDPSTNVCYMCPTGYSYSMAKSFCVSVTCPSGQIYNISTGNCSCHTSTPYFYNNTCNKCPVNNYLLNGKCHACWNGSFFNTTAMQC